MSQFSPGAEIAAVENTQAFARAFATDFKPSAYFDRHLDCIRAQLRDVSVTEHRVNRMITILEENYTAEKKFAGFTIKGVRYLMVKLGLTDSSVIKLTEFINSLVQEFPEESVQRFAYKFTQMPEVEGLEIDFSQAA